VPFLFEAGLLEASTHSLAKFLHGLGDPGKFHMFAGAGFQLPQLGSEAFQALLQFWPSPLVFFQGNHARQIGLCQAFHLMLGADTRLAQVLPADLQFLGKPLPPLCPRPRQDQTLRVQQHLAHISPDQVVQLSNRQQARGALLRARRLQQRSLAITGVVGVARIGRASGTCQLAQPTTDHGTQEILMLGVIAAGDALIVLEFFLDHLKLFLADDGRDLSHHNPVFWRHALDTAVASPDWFERGNPSGCRSIVIASCIHCTRIHRSCQNMTDGAIAPMEAAARSAHPKLPQMFSQPAQRMPVLLLVGKHLRHRCCFRRLQAHPCWITWMGRVCTIPIGGRSPRQQRAGTILLQAASSHAISNQVALVFGHRSADLQHELVVGILAHRPLEKLDVAAAFFQFLDQEHLIDLLAGESAWGRDQNPIKARLCRLLT